MYAAKILLLKLAGEGIHRDADLFSEKGFLCSMTPLWKCGISILGKPLFEKRLFCEEKKFYKTVTPRPAPQGFYESLFFSIAFLPLFVKNKKKHYQRHNGPEGSVHITSSCTNLDQILSFISCKSKYRSIYKNENFETRFVRDNPPLHVFLVFIPPQIDICKFLFAFSNFWGVERAPTKRKLCVR